MSAQTSIVACAAVAIDAPKVAADLDAEGAAIVEGFLERRLCEELAGLYARQELFRSRVVMARHGFGRGEYKYFRYPLPGVVATLRDEFYPHLAPIANRWNEAMGVDRRFPEAHADFLETCHRAGQDKSTPLVLEYGPGDYNCLH